MSDRQPPDRLQVEVDHLIEVWERWDRKPTETQNTSDLVEVLREVCVITGQSPTWARDQVTLLRRSSVPLDVAIREVFVGE